MEIRQIALVARDLPAVRHQLFALSGLDTAFTDHEVAQFGLTNIVMPLGNSFLEVVSPQQAGTTAGRLLDRRGDCGYMVIVQVDDWRAERNRVEAAGIQVVWEFERGPAKGFHMHPRDVPGAIASMDWADPPAEWYYAGEGWQQRKARYVSGIRAAEIGSDNPSKVAERWALAYGQELSLRDDTPVLTLGNTEVRFVGDTDNLAPGLVAVDILVEDREAMLSRAAQLGLGVDGNRVAICGTWFNLL